MIRYEKGSVELIDTIKPLWAELNEYHKTVSEHFTDDFLDDKYNKRKSLISCKDYVRITIAYDGGTPVGYLVASVHDGQGEVDSLYVKKQYRGLSVGDDLMEHSLAWIRSFNPESIKISVAYGNPVLPFYEKHGFLPRSFILMDTQTLNSK